MKAYSIESFVLALALSNVVAGSLASEPSATEAEVVRFGVTHSSWIISGKFLDSCGGGGGATARVKIDEVLKAPVGFRIPESIAVYYLSAKEPFVAFGEKVPYTNSFLFFLCPASTNAQTGYEDVTEKAHPFVRATARNVGVLRSGLLNHK